MRCVQCSQHRTIRPLEAAALLNTALRAPALSDTWLQRIRGNILKGQSRKRITAIHKKMDRCTSGDHDR